MSIYQWTRDSHLYLGLFVSPFVVLFSLSVFFLNHARSPAQSRPTSTTTVHDLRIPPGIEETQDMERVHLATEIITQAGVIGEINFIRHVARERRLIIPVQRPGIETTVDVNLETRTATITERRTTAWERLAYLHRMPGPHNASIRGNWFWTRAWRWLADITVWLVLFLSVSGIYLWAVLRSERRVGLVLLLAGAVSFGGIVYAVIA